MTKKEQALVDDLDQFINKWKAWKGTEAPPEIPIFPDQAKLFKSVCDKIDQGMLPGNIDPKAKTYRGVLIRCQY